VAFRKQVCVDTLSVDEIYHLASPASPPHYMYNPIKTIKTNTIGTINMLGMKSRPKLVVFTAADEMMCNYTVFQKKFTLLLFAVTKSDVDRFH